jgi:Rod binding domain-containing protein
MSSYGFTPFAVPPQLLSQPAGPANTAELAKRAQIKDTAERFEASFLSSMLQEMFAGLETSGPFGGGQGEEMFRSMMIDQYAKGLTARGGFGLAASMQAELLKHQQAPAQ